MPVPRVQLPIAFDLQTPSERRTAVVRDVAALAATILKLEFDSRVINHTGSLGLKRPLHRLIVGDGDGQVGFELFGTTNLTAEQREVADAHRLALEEHCILAAGVVEDWKTIICDLHRISTSKFSREYVDLRAMSMGSDGKTPERLFFCAFDFSPRVSVGNLCQKVHEILVPYARVWVGRMTSVIREELFLDNYGKRINGAYDAQADAELLAVVQDAIVEAVCTQISMSAKKPSDADECTDYVDASVCDHLLKLINERINLRKTAKKSIAICKNSLGFLERAVYSGEVEACFPKRGRVSETLRDVPYVLRSRPGFRSLWCKLDAQALLQAMNASTLVEFSTRLAEWRANVDEGIRLAFSTMLKTAMEITAEQTEFVDSSLFLETSYHCMPIEPPWAYKKQELFGAYAVARTSVCFARKVQGSVPPMKRPYLPLSINVELALRLVSTIRELCADEQTANAYFGAGKVPAGYFKELCIKEKIDFVLQDYEVEKLRHQVGFGVNYRNAVSKLERWRGSSRETEVRDAISKVARWSLVDLASVMSDRGPVFASTAPHVLYETTSAISRMREAPSLVQRVLTMALPWLMDVRHELRVCPTAPSSPLLELLVEAPIVREFVTTGHSDRLRRDETELVLTHEDLMGCRGRVEDTLKTLAGQGQLVVHKKRRAKVDAEFGNKRVFTLSTQGLLALAERA